jgi:allantoinase
VRAAAGNLWVDAGLWGGAIPGNELELQRLLDAGALGFKCFLVPSGVDEFPHVEPADLSRALSALAGTGAPLLVHAELQGPLDAALRALGTNPDPRRYLHYLRSRPTEAEDQAVALLVRLCRETRARVHVVHLASSDALGSLREARDQGLPFSAETTPHYLALAAEAVPDGDTAYKCAPPIREARHRDRLWEALAEGLLGQVVTDHSPCTPELKLPERGDFLAAWGGIASLQFGLPVVWTEARARGHALGSILRWMAEAPAALCGLGHRKGRLLPGHDADLVLWDPEASFTLTPERIEHRHKVTPYLGRTLYGAVRRTWVRGRTVYQDRPAGPWFSPAPTGRWLPRETP